MIVESPLERPRWRRMQLYRLTPTSYSGGISPYLAILGSGKSCTLAGLIRWSLKGASEERVRLGMPPGPNARFIVLDPNGEYVEAFKDLRSRIFRVPPEAR